MAITHFASATNPADNAVLTDSAAQSVTPPGSMVAGQLVYVEVVVRLSGETITINDAGGQTWTSLTNRASGSVTSRGFWCVFNGTWSSNPAFESANKIGGAMTIVMSVYAPTGAGYTWSVDQAEAFNAYTASTVITITGQTPVLPSTLTVADWITDGDTSTFSSLTGGWTNPLATAQIRSTQGTGTASARAHLIQTSAAATGNVSNTSSASTNGHRRIITFAETAPTSGGSQLTARVRLRSLIGGALAR